MIDILDQVIEQHRAAIERQQAALDGLLRLRDEMEPEHHGAGFADCLRGAWVSYVDLARTWEVSKEATRKRVARIKMSRAGAGLPPLKRRSIHGRSHFLRDELDLVPPVHPTRPICPGDRRSPAPVALVRPARPVAMILPPPPGALCTLPPGDERYTRAMIAASSFVEVDDLPPHLRPSDGVLATIGKVGTAIDMVSRHRDFASAP